MVSGKLYMILQDMLKLIEESLPNNFSNYRRNQIMKLGEGLYEIFDGKTDNENTLENLLTKMIQEHVKKTDIEGYEHYKNQIRLDILMKLKENHEGTDND